MAEEVVWGIMAISSTVSTPSSWWTLSAWGILSCWGTLCTQRILNSRWNQSHIIASKARPSLFGLDQF